MEKLASIDSLTRVGPGVNRPLMRDTPEAIMMREKLWKCRQVDHYGGIQAHALAAGPFRGSPNRERGWIGCKARGMHMKWGDVSTTRMN